MDQESRIAAHVREIPPSAIRQFFEIVQGMDEVISLGIGEPDFVTPWHIREAAIYSLERGRTSYTSNLGLPRLRGAIARYVRDRFGASYDPRSEVLVTVGVSEALDLALRAFVNPGDEVVCHEPCYVSYHPGVALAHGRCVAVPTSEEDGFVLRAEALEACLTPRARMLILSFPTNPTGAVLPDGELERIAEVCCRHDLLVLTDEIYSELTYDDADRRSIVSLPGMRERCILLHGLSKAFAMTGFRVGYACGPRVLVEAMMKVHQYGILCAPTVSQDAAIEALENGAPAMEAMRREYQVRRDFVARELNRMGLTCAVPGGAFYLFPSIRSTGLTSREFALGLLQRGGVAVVPGDAFGASGEGHVRCCYATSFERLRVAMTRMEDYVNGLEGGSAPAERDLERGAAG